MYYQAWMPLCKISGKKKMLFLYINEVAYDLELEEKHEITRRIHHVLKPNQLVLVQVTKDPMKTKGARLTTYISAGRAWYPGAGAF